MTAKAWAVGRSVVAQYPSYLELCKPKVVQLLVFTALVGMFLASPGLVPWSALIFGNLGIALAAASAAAINHLVDQRVDAIMGRTASRPLPSGELDPVQSLIFALVLGAAGLSMLGFLVNPLTAALTFISLMGYAVIYTWFLKRATPQNIVIGGAAGAAPPILGWTAVTGTVEPGALMLFLIIFLWTPPHFWALALHRRDEYAKAALPMLPVTHGVAFTKLQILLYTILLGLATLLPVWGGVAGWVYLAGIVPLNGFFLYHVIRLYRGEDPRQPIRTFVVSIRYMMALFALLLLDHYIPLNGPFSGIV